MPLAKIYRRFALEHVFGVTSTAKSGSTIVFDKSGKYAIVPALEGVAIHSLEEQRLVRLLRDETSSALVTRIAENPQKSEVAVGYADGCIRVWSVPDGKCRMTLNAHRRAISALRFNSDGALLASGSQDTDIILWDMLTESGRFRLRGHRNEVTAVALLDRGTGGASNKPSTSKPDAGYQGGSRLISASKDGLVKVWHLDTQHCVQTITAHRHEVWSLAVTSDESLLVTGSTDQELRVWRLDFDASSSAASQSEQKASSDQMDTSDDLPPADFEPATYIGSVKRSSNKRVAHLAFNSRQNVLFSLGVDKFLESFRVRSAEEIEKKLKRKRKRQREKLRSQGNDVAKYDTSLTRTPTASDMFESLTPLRAHTRISAFSVLPSKSTLSFKKHPHERILVALNDNSVHLYDANLTNEEKPYDEKRALDRMGHHSGVRAVSLSDDDKLMLTTSSEQLKVWNTHSRNCIQTLESGYGLTAIFAPGTRHAVVGTKEGDVEIYDLASSALVQRSSAHAGGVWSISARPDGRGFATGGTDHTVKFWDYELVQGDSSSSKQLAAVHTRTLKLTEDVLAVRYSHDGKYIAVALLDSTVKVFFEDSLKFSLSLYGHKLPVLCLDISDDDELLVSGSADKNVKVFGMNFGDCHKSLFAHDDSVMQVKFVPKTHYFFSCGKDKVIKYWDADTFQQIFVLRGHHAEVWSLAVSSLGDFIVSSSNDKSLRIWGKSDEQVTLDEEKERELNELFDQEAQVNHEGRPTAIEGSNLPGEASESAKASKRTKESLTFAERLIEALDRAEHEAERFRDYEEAQRRKNARKKDKSKGKQSRWLENAMEDDSDTEFDAKPPKADEMLRGRTPDDYVLDELKAVPFGDLEEALLVLPFGSVVKLLKFLASLVNKASFIELIMNTALACLRIHEHQISSDATLLPVLRTIRETGTKHLQEYRDLIGRNLAAVAFLRQLHKDSAPLSSIDEDPFAHPEHSREPLA